MKLTLHARVEILILSGLLLGSCSEYHSPSETYDLADVARVNSVNALYKIEELESRVSEIEYRLDM